MKKRQSIRTFKGKRVVSRTLNRKKAEYIAGEILVGIKDEYRELIQNKKERERLKQALLRKLPGGANILRDFDELGKIKIGVSEKADVIRLIKILNKIPEVKYAEPNIIFETCQVVPNEYPNINALAANQWGLERIRAPWAWNSTTGNSRVLIVIIDSGLAGPERSAGAIYRWYNPSNGDHFYCTDPLGEFAHGGGYRYEGSPFRLYPAGTLNTTPFYRFYNPSNGHHFYSIDPNAESAPGYQPEGSIGNIAFPAPLPGSVPLYRWYNPASGDHFYCTDQYGELAPQSGYQSEGIVGYVDPASSSLLSHPDLANQSRFMHSNDYVHDDNFPVDDLGHGTHVTGIAAADTNNNVGIAGMTWTCNVLVIKVFEITRRATAEHVSDAILEAVRFGTSRGLRIVVNFSGRSTAPSGTLESAVGIARDNSCLIVAATGNDSDHARVDPLTGKANPLRAPVGWPAAYSTKYENVIAVGAIDNANNLYALSNVGPEVSVVAPGVRIRSTLPNYVTPDNPTGSPYGDMDGTSMATPHVTGLAALMLSINQNLSPQTIRDLIQTTADDLGPQGRDDDFGYGRINCERAVSVLTGGTVFRWYNPSNGDHFYCTDPNGESAPGYRYEGAPFRLFPIGTLNTKQFFRFYNPSNGHHFYSIDPNAESAPGYQPEGSIGNIAFPAQLPGTMALYRWYNPASGDHFYSTDQYGESAPGYQSEGIAGYVMIL